MHVTMDGKRMRALREEQGLSKKDLARKAGVAEPTIKRAEDSGQMSPATVIRLSDALGVDARSLGTRGPSER